MARPPEETEVRRIDKIVREGDVPPTLPDYAEATRSFTWSGARAEELDGLPDGRGLNIAHEAVDRHAAGPAAERVAIRWRSKGDERRDLTYRELARRTSQAANALVDLGLQPGETLFALSGRTPELYEGVLGALKARLVVSPLFAAFGPEPVQTRMSLGRASALLTTRRLYDRRVLPIRDALPHLRHVLLTDAGGGPLPPGTRSFHELVDQAGADFTIPPTDPEDPALLHFTSGTTGTPKGAMHVHEAVLQHHVTGKLALDLHPGDRFWCTADPGWVTGTSYGIIAPLTNGVTMIVDEAEFDVERWYRILEEEKVNVWYTAPTAIRMLMKAGAEVARGYDLSELRFIASVGEPLNPEAVLWGREALGLPIHDNWWQTETGGIMIANYRSMQIRPGSMGRPMPGVDAAIVRRQQAEETDRGTLEFEDPDVEGELAIRKGWPSMFRAYLGQEERYQRSFSGDWYLTGDVCRKDADGYFWFVGRADDVIKSAGHLIGPFEVESALIEHPAVAEAAVIGKPDPTLGEVVKAFVALRSGHQATEELKLDLIGHARRRLGSAVAPREIDIVDELPHTRSGKVMRRLLKARELGLPEGDTSTLESSGGGTGGGTPMDPQAGPEAEDER
jgi:acetyl-CoA synthetase